MTRQLRIGFIPLVDAALLVAAARLGFAEEEGLALDLVREVSWANIRDRLVLGQFDAAHMLAPAAIASTLGLGHLREPMVVPAVLSLNGNAVTLATSLHADVAARAGASPSPQATAKAVAAIVAERAARGEEPLTFGHVFPFSTHHYVLRAWLALGGIDPDQDVRLVVLPPQYMVGGLRSGQVHGFCVGAPWNSIAVASGEGVILHFGTDLVQDAPEKVLALRASHDANDPAAVEALCRALARAARWAAGPESLEPLARLLADPEVLDVDAGALRAILSGDLLVEAPSRRRTEVRYIRFSPDILTPDPADAEWIYRQMVEAGQTPHRDAGLAAARAVYRPDRWLAAQGSAAGAAT